MALRKIGAAWRGKDGSKAALSGSLDFLGESLRFVVVKNEHRKGDRDPEFLVMRVLPDDEKGETKPAPASRPASDVPF